MSELLHEPDFAPAAIEIATVNGVRTRTGWAHDSGLGVWPRTTTDVLLGTSTEWLAGHLATGSYFYGPFPSRAAAVAAVRELSRIKNNWKTTERDDFDQATLRDRIVEICQRHGARWDQGAPTDFDARPMNKVRVDD